MKKLILMLLCFVGSYTVFAQTKSLEEHKKEVGVFEHLDQYIPDSIMLYNQDSVLVDVKSLIDKPTVFSFVYYNCPGICGPLLTGLSEVIERSELVLGKDYQVITISMNTSDGPFLGIPKKRNFVTSIKKDIDESQWIWLTGDSINIAKITNALGFKFYREGDDFIHAAAIMVVTPKGKIARYLHGTYFLPFDLKMAVVEAADEKSGATITKMLKFCFSYDPSGKKYVLNTTKISAIIIMSLVLGLFLILVIKKPKKNKNSIIKTDI